MKTRNQNNSTKPNPQELPSTPNGLFNFWLHVWYYPVNRWMFWLSLLMNRFWCHPCWRKSPIISFLLSKPVTYGGEIVKAEVDGSISLFLDWPSIDGIPRRYQKLLAPFFVIPQIPCSFFCSFFCRLKNTSGGGFANLLAPFFVQVLQKYSRSLDLPVHIKNYIAGILAGKRCGARN